MVAVALVTTPSELPSGPVPAPVDDRRLVRLYLGASAILDQPDRHTPLELRWAREVRDLCLALTEARRQSGGSGAPDDNAG